MSAETERGRLQYRFTVVGTIDKNGMPIFWIEDPFSMDESVWDSVERKFISRETVWRTDDRLHDALGDLLAKANDNG